ncbi:hypothetical protein SSAG_06328 [Streptomyces sp. Mg1]|nr:hypothetical protein [Streptomyces sp. Mg1]EDX26539.1 hypothetical protein SSAG_06328 [Streptomyces sp. Mg1]
MAAPRTRPRRRLLRPESYEEAAALGYALSPQEVTRLTELLLAPVLDIVAAGLLPHQSTPGIGMKYDYQPS